MAKCPHCKDELEPLPHYGDLERCPGCDCIFSIPEYDREIRYAFYVSRRCVQRRTVDSATLRMEADNRKEGLVHE